MFSLWNLDFQCVTSSIHAFIDVATISNGDNKKVYFLVEINFLRNELSIKVIFLN